MFTAARSPVPLPPVAATLIVALVLRWWMPMSLAALGGQVALVLAAWHLLVRARAPQPERAAAVLLLLPGVALAPSGFWAAAATMAFAAALDRKQREMLLWCGVAIGLDALGAMIVPFVLALAIQRRVPLKVWPIAPLAAGTALLLLPATTLPASDLALSYGAPNLWSIAQSTPGLGTVPLIGLAFCAVTGASAAYAAWFSARPLHPRTILDAALLCLLAVTGLLPHADPHAFLLAGVLAVTLALTTASSRHLHVAFLVQAGSLLALGGFGVAGAIAMLAATFVHARAVLAPAANDNPLMARAI